MTKKNQQIIERTMRIVGIFVKPLLLGLVSLSIFINSAQANRRFSLSQNQLMEDREDVFLFPQLALEYRNLLNLDLGVSAQEGRLLFLSGWNNLALGLAAYNSALLPPDNYVFANPIAGDVVSYETYGLYLGEVRPIPFPVSTIGSLWGDAQPFSVVDGFIAVPMGDGLFGARLGLGSRADIEFFEDNNDDEGVMETFVTLEAGLSGRDEVRYDTSLNVTIDIGRVQNREIPQPFDPFNILDTAVDVDDASLTLIRASLSGRGYFPFADKIELGVLGNIVFTNGSIELDLPDADRETTRNIMGAAIMGGAGPVYRISEHTTLGGYGLLGVVYATQDSNDTVDGDSLSDLVFYLPAVHVAADIGITNWFFFRAGLRYSFQLSMTSIGDFYQDEDNFQNASEVRGETSHRRDGGFGWSVGLGLEHEGFTLDGALQPALLTSGPYFIGGTNAAGFGSGMFIVVSAGYHWL